MIATSNSFVTMLLEKQKKCVFIEHTLHPEVLLRRLAEHLRNGGKLIITNLSCCGPTEQRPMHFGIPFDAKKSLNSLGLSKANLDWLWMKDLRKQSNTFEHTLKSEISGR